MALYGCKLKLYSLKSKTSHCYLLVIYLKSVFILLFVALNLFLYCLLYLFIMVFLEFYEEIDYLPKSENYDGNFWTLKRAKGKIR